MTSLGINVKKQPQRGHCLYSSASPKQSLTSTSLHQYSSSLSSLKNMHKINYHVCHLNFNFSIFFPLSRLGNAGNTSLAVHFCIKSVKMKVTIYSESPTRNLNKLPPLISSCVFWLMCFMSGKNRAVSSLQFFINM